MHKYYREDIFDKNTFYEISEKDFEEEVIEHRGQYTIKYFNTYKQLTDKNTGLRYKVYYPK